MKLTEWRRHTITHKTSLIFVKNELVKMAEKEENENRIILNYDDE